MDEIIEYKTVAATKFILDEYKFSFLKKMEVDNYARITADGYGPSIFNTSFTEQMARRIHPTMSNLTDYLRGAAINGSLQSRIASSIHEAVSILKMCGVDAKYTVQIDPSKGSIFIRIYSLNGDTYFVYRNQPEEMPYLVRNPEF